MDPLPISVTPRRRAGGWPPGWIIAGIPGRVGSGRPARLAASRERRAPSARGAALVVEVVVGERLFLADSAAQALAHELAEAVGGHAATGGLQGDVLATEHRAGREVSRRVEALPHLDPGVPLEVLDRLGS